MSNLIEIKKKPDENLVKYLESLLDKAKNAAVTSIIILVKEPTTLSSAMYGIEDSEDAIRFVGHLELAKQNIVISLLSESEHGDH